jgi:hypothetical protein
MAIKFITSKPLLGPPPTATVTPFPQPSPLAKQWVHRYSVEAWQQAIYAAWRTAGLSGLEAAPDGSGPVMPCPRCKQRLKLTDGAVCCPPPCGWRAAGEPWDIAQAGAAAKVSAPVVTDGTLPLWTLESLLAHEPNPADEIWAGGVLSAGERSALVGSPGVGKSRITLQAALCTILGRPFLGLETRAPGAKWLFLQTENSGRRLKHDLSLMCQGLSAAERREVNGCLRILNVDALDFGSICMAPDHPDRERIAATIAAFDPLVCVIDPLRDAGRGDLNKDDGMTETCQGIGEVIRAGNPRRVPLVVHHGRTGSMEAGKVFGDDASSFARNSKVLYGWLRSQINVAAAGIDYPGVIIFGCGKCSNGPQWGAFAARLDDQTMTYRRLEADEFDLDEWTESMGGKPRKTARQKLTPQQVADVLGRAGGEVAGGIRADDGLVAKVRRAYGVSRDEAATAVERALGETIQHVDRAVRGGMNGGRVYVLKGVKSEG